MPLDEYRKKRNFTSTPEPKGDETVAASRARRSAGYFCVQKHLATALHYDFRLEHNGVLLSWAVPKGPSLDPSVKRLAMQTEDHPIEYGDFEGVIPEGYGAGVVMLWDYGTWTPESDDVAAALAKGDLKMTLDGFKLKGSWVLVRTRGWGQSKGRDDGRSWLLIKHRDEWAGALDIAEFAPKSVKSGGTFREILAQDAPDVWLSNRGATGEASMETLAAVLSKLDAIEPIETGQERRREGTKERRRAGTKERRREGTKERRRGGTKERRRGGTKERRREGTKERRREGTEERRMEGRGTEGGREGKGGEGKGERGEERGERGGERGTKAKSRAAKKR